MSIAFERCCAIALALIVAAGFAPTARAVTPMNIGFGSGEVTVRNVTAGHQVVLFGVGIGAHGRAALLTRTVEVVADDDRDGTVTVRVRTLPSRSVWVAVDYQSADYAVATPTGETPRALDVAADAWRGNAPHFDVTRAYLEVLVIRPDVGAWTLRAADGGRNDADGSNNRVSRIRLDRMDRLIGDKNGPPFVKQKDLAVAIDPQTLELFIREAR